MVGFWLLYLIGVSKEILLPSGRGGKGKVALDSMWARSSEDGGIANVPSAILPKIQSV